MGGAGLRPGARDVADVGAVTGGKLAVGSVGVAAGTALVVVGGDGNTEFPSETGTALVSADIVPVLLIQAGLKVVTLYAGLRLVPALQG